MINPANFKYKTIIGGLALLVILASPLRSLAFERSQNNDGTVCYYWKIRILSFYVNESCSQDVNTTDCIQAVENSLAAWAEQSCTDLVLNYAGPTSQTNASGMDSFNLIVWRELSNWDYEQSAIAMTTTTFGKYSGQIIDADIEVNGDYTFSTSGASNAMDIQNTLTHELGHCIGLADLYNEADSNATMYFQAEKGETNKRDLSQDDINGLCTIYPAGGKTPLCSNSSDSGGCATTIVGSENILNFAFLALLLWMLRKNLRRVCSCRNGS